MEYSTISISFHFQWRRPHVGVACQVRVPDLLTKEMASLGCSAETCATDLRIQDGLPMIPLTSWNDQGVVISCVWIISGVISRADDQLMLSAAAQYGIPHIGGLPNAKRKLCSVHSSPLTIMTGTSQRHFIDIPMIHLFPSVNIYNFFVEGVCVCMLVAYCWIEGQVPIPTFNVYLLHLLLPILVRSSHDVDALERKLNHSDTPWSLRSDICLAVKVEDYGISSRQRSQRGQRRHCKRSLVGSQTIFMRARSRTGGWSWLLDAPVIKILTPWFLHDVLIRYVLMIAHVFVSRPSIGTMTTIQQAESWNLETLRAA